MKGFVTNCMTAFCMTSGLAAVGGCDRYWNLVDPCYPERYEYAARNEVIAAFTPQVNNGHFLDQTVWNYHFEPGTDKLTPGGMEHLTYLARRRPFPDNTVYLATAHERDLAYDPAAPADKYPKQREELDRKRIQAIKNYLAAETAGRPVSFEVIVHDPAEVSLAAQPVFISVGKMYSSFQGALGGGGGGVAGGPGGAGSTTSTSTTTTTTSPPSR